MKDALLMTTAALPAAAANNNHAAIDIGKRAGPGGDFPSGSVEAVVEWPALANLGDTHAVTFTVQDSADGSTGWASIGLVKATPAGAGGAGIAAGNIRWRLPRTVRRYIRLNQAVPASGGNNTASSTTFSLVFGDL